MKLNGLNILLISPEPWSDIRVSKHHYASHLAARGNNVYFLNPPGTVQGADQMDPHLWIVDYKPIIRGLHRLPGWINQFCIQWELEAIEKQIQISFDLIWNFDPSRFFNLSRIRCYKICHIVDWNQKFQRKKLASTSDLCLSTNSFLIEEFSTHNKNSFFLNHGYNETEIGESSIDILSEAFKVGYMGNLNIRYLDWSLIHSVVQNHPELEFYFIGPFDLKIGTKAMNETHQLANSHFLGPVPSQEVMSYLIKMDLLILTYTADQHKIQLANPHKLLEYLATGQPILSTYTDAYKDSDLIVMSESNHQFSELFDHLVSNYEQYSTVQLKKARINFSKTQSYGHQIDKIEKLLTQTLAAH